MAGLRRGDGIGARLMAVKHKNEGTQYRQVQGGVGKAVRANRPREAAAVRIGRTPTVPANIQVVGRTLASQM